MTIAHLLEDFGIDVSAALAMPVIPEEDIEEQRLESFENGYSAGWDDAVTAKDQESTRISTELASSLEDLNFTYHEAQSQLLDSLDPMFKVLISAVLPDTMAASFGHHLVDQLAGMAKGQTDQPMQIVVSPGEGAPVRKLLPQNFSVPVTVVEDGTLSQGQAYLRVGSSECEINCDALLESVQESIEAFTYHTKEDSQYG